MRRERSQAREWRVTFFFFFFFWATGMVPPWDLVPYANCGGTDFVHDIVHITQTGPQGHFSVGPQRGRGLSPPGLPPCARHWRWHRRAYIVSVQRIFSKMALGIRRRIWIKFFFFFFFFAHKKYSRSFVKLRLNPWCHMDYFTDLLATFLDLIHVRTLAVYGGSESCQNSSKIS